MLFKTLSASVYGIDAYLVEVEVDVGSARMTDFNVVGFPDNAVKESRERIKSALRNCGFEFPHGQGVTINLAPADVRKEGSAFDLPMALGLTGCMGQFFGKLLDKCMFLGELSLDGSVRPVRGALSAALAARELGLKSVAVPEANAREAAVVEGVDVFGLKSLPQAVDLVNSPESFLPVRVDAQQLLTEAAQYTVDLRDVHGQQAAKRALEVACGRSQHFVHRTARGWQNDARQAHPHNLAAHVARGGHRNHAYPQRRRCSGRFPRPGGHAPLPLPAPHHQRRRPHRRRRRRRAQARRSIARPQRRALPRRTA